MSSLFRATTLGLAVRWVSSRTLLRYPDEIEPLKFCDTDSNKKGPAITIAPVEGGEDSNLGQDTREWSFDPENPLNWSTAKKSLVTALICIYTFAVYLGSSIILASLPYVVEEFHVSELTSSLTLAIYVLGYGSGCMLFSPLSEVASIGRNPPYIFSFILFVVFSATAAQSKSFAELIVWRFFQGYMGSPALATGGASLQDMFSLSYLPFSFTLWIGAAAFAPAIGPVISAYSVPAETWRWSLWEVLWLAAFVLVILVVLLPETFAAKILYDRQTRLRRLFPTTVFANDHQRPPIKSILYTALVRPTTIMLTEPAVAFANFFTCLMYGIYYSFFESFPRVFITSYHFTHQELGLAFLSIAIGAILGVVLYLPWAFYWARNVETMGPRRAEKSLIPGIPGSALVPVGLFLFAWSSEAHCHYLVPLLGVVVQTAGFFIVLQCLSNYVILAYPTYAASLFAGNDFLRSSFATAAILFSHPLYEHLGVAKGVTILAAGTVVCCGGMTVLFLVGDRLRAEKRPQTTAVVENVHLVMV